MHLKELLTFALWGWLLGLAFGAGLMTPHLMLAMVIGWGHYAHAQRGAALTKVLNSPQQPSTTL